MSGRHMNARPKRLTRKQKEALSAHGWDSRQYLFIQDSPDAGGWVLMTQTTGHYADYYTHLTLPPSELVQM